MRASELFSFAAAALSLSLVATIAPARAQEDGGLAAARTLMQTALKSQCTSDVVGPDSDERFEFRFRYSYESASDPEHVAVLYHIGCGAGAYNLIDGYVLRNEYDEMSILPFAEPELDVKYENDDFEGKVESIRIVGFGAVTLLINSSVDAEKQTITSYNKWRGLGDAWSSSTWQFREGRFVLVKSEVDPTYDGEIKGVVVYEAPHQ